MRAVTRALIAGLLLCTAAVEACVQAHNYMNNRWNFDDIMSMTVYVNGHVVCRGSDSAYLASSNTEFCLRNHDGAGRGCAPGYVYCVTNNGGSAYLEYYQDSQSIWRKDLKVKTKDQMDRECGGTNGQLKCLQVESCLEVEDISCPADSCETCDYIAFCNGDKINPPNPFPYLPPVKPFKAMVVGDSISHGMNGDFTWRWRLFYWLQDVLGSQVRFVGPWRGTKGRAPPGSARPRPPRFPDEPEVEIQDLTGFYDERVPNYFSMGSDHASRWGRQAAQSRHTIRQWVEEYQPDYLLVLLGFNDLGWWVSGPEGLVGDMGNLVENARKAKPDIKILLGNVVDRTFIKGRQDLVDNTIRYNQLLRERMENWFRWESPLVYVDVNSNYNCRPHTGCPDAYDGLHPNSMGEYHIAEAFARSIKQHFGYKGPDFVVPPNPERRDVSTPTGVRTLSRPEGLFTSWDTTRRDRGYDMRTRVQGMTDWWSEGPVGQDSGESWSTWVVSGQTWEIQVRARGDNDDRSAWSPMTTTTVDVQTSPGPPNIVVLPSGDGLQVTWAPTTTHNVNRYSVIIWDRDTEGSFIDMKAVAGTSYFYGGLKQGHRYSVWVATWVNLDGGVAGGLPASGRDVRIGGGAPAVPGNLRITESSPVAVTLRWDAMAGAAGYAVYTYSVLDGTLRGQPSLTTLTTHGLGFLFPGSWAYRLCVTAFNGNLESSPTAACVVPPMQKRDIAVEGDDMVVTNTSTVYNETTMVEDKDLATLMNLLMVQAYEDASTPISDDAEDDDMVDV